jgi:hypothetical protein
MTEKPYDGGLAFPGNRLEKSDDEAGVYYRADHPGMTLRDWFAGQAIMGLCADPSNHELFDSHEDAAKSAYFIADAMIAARGGN